MKQYSIVPLADLNQVNGEVPLMKIVFDFLKRTYFYRSMIMTMAIREIQSRYAGTLAGFVWSVINPLMMILVFWFIFSVGFKIQPLGNVPFIVVFLCGLIPWTMFHETLMANTNAITRNVHLVKKMVFPTEMLSIVNLVASLVSHGIMLVILLVLLLFYKIPLSFYNFQFLYYFIALSVFTLGLSWLFSAVNVFYRDVGQILSVILTMWFWLTPIVWLMDMIPKDYHFIIKLNPIYYIVEGYRFAFIYHIPFWFNYNLGVYFWSLSLALVIMGGSVFRKLKPEFADVL
jgi:lipopolysaccharide transport system permease protein/teichoic acid transport system permease protein